jgi:hypothetical protein
MSWPPRRERLLIRHFLWRLLEHDLVSPNTDRHAALSAIGGSMLALSLFVSVMIAAQYQFNNDMPPGMTSMFWLDDRFFSVSAAMLIAALAATAEWNALVLEPRDAMILGALPVPKPLIVRAKFAATGLFALAVIAIWNGPPALTRVATVPVGLRLGWGDVAIITAGQIVSSCAAGMFGFVAVLCVREIAGVALGQARFLRISAALQAALMVGLTTALLLLPATSAGFHRRWLSQPNVVERLLPPLWFVGLNETIAGGAIDRLPRQEPRERRLRVPEQAATRFYRQLWPAFRRQARTAIAALLLVSSAAIAATLWNARRLSIAGGRLSKSSSWRMPIALLTPFAARTALAVAGFLFSVQTLSRRVTHRMTLAIALAVGLAFVAVAAGRARVFTDVAAPAPVSLLAAQFLLVGTALIGFRHATRLPADLNGSVTFSIAWPGKPDEYLAGVRRSGWLIVGPLLTFCALAHAVLGGWAFAAAHTAVGAAYTYTCLRVVFLRNHHLPYVSPYVPGDDAKLRFIMCGGALLVSSLAVATVERRVLSEPILLASSIAALLAAGRGCELAARLMPMPAVTVDLDESAPLPTQRLDLA